ncbi:MAG: DUF502 domain-containing protein [Pseudomonadota bacterium]
MRFIFSIVQPIITGILAVLPIFLTLVLIGTIASYVADYLGPGSAFGQLMAKLGSNLVDDNLAYMIGVAIVLGALYVIGLMVQTRLRRVWNTFFNETVGRVPLIGTIYRTISRFVQLLEKKDDVDVKSMSPVWCFFSDERKTAVLGLMPTSDTVALDGTDYRIVMVPTAPVPFGGGLFFLPADWVQPASFGVDGLTNIYVSMGVAAPDYMGALRRADGATPQMVRRDGTMESPAADGPERAGPVRDS